MTILKNFGYLHAGKIPIRGEANGWRIVPGWPGECDWKGYIPHAELPRSINPDIGYTVTCNQRVTDHQYPYYVGLYFSPEHRAKRVQARILELEFGQATVEKMKQIHTDIISIPAQVFTERLIQVRSSDRDTAQAQSLLQEWDYSMDRNLVQPLIYAQTKREVTRQIAQVLLGDQADLVLSGEAGSYAHLRLIELEILLAIKSDDNSFLPTGKSWQEVLSFALQYAVASLKAKLGDDMSQWRWERLHYTHPQHPLSAIFPELAEKLDPPSVSIHGDGDTPLAGSYGFNNQFIATGMSVNRYIHDPADWTNSLWIVPLGASGHPGSPHYADQVQMWADVEYIPQLWDWNQIALESESHQQLSPYK